MVEGGGVKFGCVSGLSFLRHNREVYISGTHSYFLSGPQVRILLTLTMHLTGRVASQRKPLLLKNRNMHSIRDRTARANNGERQVLECTLADEQPVRSGTTRLLRLGFNHAA